MSKSRGREGARDFDTAGLEVDEPTAMHDGITVPSLQPCQHSKQGATSTWSTWVTKGTQLQPHTLHYSTQGYSVHMGPQPFVLSTADNLIRTSSRRKHLFDANRKQVEGKQGCFARQISLLAKQGLVQQPMRRPGTLAQAILDELVVTGDRPPPPCLDPAEEKAPLREIPTVVTLRFPALSPLAVHLDACRVGGCPKASRNAAETPQQMMCRRSKYLTPDCAISLLS